MFALFGSSDSRRMPDHLLYGALFVDHSTARRADVSKQKFGVCPRHWYVDASFRCRTCGATFVFSAAEQQLWFEDLRLWIDSLPRNRPGCRRRTRRFKTLRQEYDRDIKAALRRDAPLEAKQRLVAILDSLQRAGVTLSPSMQHHRDLLTRQVCGFFQNAGGPEAGWEVGRSSMKRDARTESLISSIEAAYAGAPQPPVLSFLDPGLLLDPERSDTITFLEGKDWRELRAAELRQHETALTFLSPRAFEYFLPSFLVTIVREPDEADVLYDAVLSALTPSNRGFRPEQFRRRAELAAAQREAIVQVLTWAASKMEGSEAARYRISDSVNFWRDNAI